MSRDGNAGDVARLTPEARAYLRLLRCPDCLSDTEPEEVRPGIFIAHIVHDEGCPVWVAIQRGGMPPRAPRPHTPPTRGATP